MTDAQLNELVEALRAAAVPLGPCLNARELELAEERVGARFPPDLAALLQRALPVGRRTPDWRGLPTTLDDFFTWPLEGMYFDIEHNKFWPDEWGSRPDSLDEAKAIAAAHVAAAPRLIPIWGHRYIPAEPHAAGNPVFSIWQTDIIIYGNDIASFMAAEWHFRAPAWTAKDARPIRFWSWLVERNG